MHATWFHGHIKHQPASGCRGCVWFIALNYSSHPKLEALGLKTKSEGPKNSCNYVFLFFSRVSTRRRRSVNADNSKYLLLIQIFTEAPMNFCNPHYLWIHGRSRKPVIACEIHKCGFWPEGGSRYFWGYNMVLLVPFHMSSGENTFIMFDCNAIVDISWRYWKYMAAVQGSTWT